VNKSKIIFWNGTLGWIEHENYAKGSLKFVEFLEKQSNKQIIIGGGETASLIKNKNHKHFYVSTGGGALMEYLQEKINWNKNIVGLEIYE
jgi:phosphoglycerate kinase/triosephosphate isomerase